MNNMRTMDFLAQYPKRASFADTILGDLPAVFDTKMHREGRLLYPRVYIRLCMVWPEKAERLGFHQRGGVIPPPTCTRVDSQ
jgi:hypothetical protein